MQNIIDVLAALNSKVVLHFLYYIAPSACSCVSCLFAFEFIILRVVASGAVV